MSVQKQHDDLRLQLAEIGGALSDDDLDAAEQRAVKLLGQIRKRQSGGGSA